MDDLPHQGLGAKHLSLSSAHWSTRFRYTAPQKAFAHVCYRREREGVACRSWPYSAACSLAGLTCGAGRGGGRAPTAPGPRGNGTGWNTALQQHCGAQAAMAV